jgi:hypothetical protein
VDPALVQHDAAVGGTAHLPADPGSHSTR